MDRLQVIKERHNSSINSFVDGNDIDWLIEQVERYEDAIRKAMINTYDDDTNEFLRRVLQNKENDAPDYRLK